MAANIYANVETIIADSLQNIKDAVGNSGEKARLYLADVISGGEYKRLKEENNLLKEKYNSLEKKFAELKMTAVTDPLTKLYTRQKLEDDLEAQIENYQRHGTPFSLVMADIDHFKQINDTYGHDAGDKVLEKLAEVSLATIRKPDEAYRNGGEEFYFILPQTDLQGALETAERLRHNYQNSLGDALMQYAHDTPAITASFGVVSYKEGENKEELLKRVDNATYNSKHNGRNQVTNLVTNRVTPDLPFQYKKSA